MNPSQVQSCMIVIVDLVHYYYYNMIPIHVVPEAPLLKDLMPAYSYDLEELQSMEILLAVSYHACMAHDYAYNYTIIL